MSTSSKFLNFCLLRKKVSITKVGTDHYCQKMTIYMTLTAAHTSYFPEATVLPRILHVCSSILKDFAFLQLHFSPAVILVNLLEHYEIHNELYILNMG